MWGWLVLDVDGLARWLWTGLTGDQYDGNACVVCSASFTAGSARVITFVGVNDAGSPVCACTNGCAPLSDPASLATEHQSSAPTRTLLLVRPGCGAGP